MRSVDLNKAILIRKEEYTPENAAWRVIDASGKVLGRLATEIATALTGKDKSYYTPHVLSGDYVVVVNADKVVLTGKKLEQKLYRRHTGYIGNMKVDTAGRLLGKNPDKLIRLAVKRMLPKNRLARKMLRRLKVYAGPSHPHGAQVRS